MFMKPNKTKQNMEETLAFLVEPDMPIFLNDGDPRIFTCALRAQHCSRVALCACKETAAVLVRRPAFQGPSVSLEDLLHGCLLSCAPPTFRGDGRGGGNHLISSQSMALKPSQTHHRQAIGLSKPRLSTTQLPGDPGRSKREPFLVEARHF